MNRPVVLLSQGALQNPGSAARNLHRHSHHDQLIIPVINGLGGGLAMNSSLFGWSRTDDPKLFLHISPYGLSSPRTFSSEAQIKTELW